MYPPGMFPTYGAGTLLEKPASQMVTDVCEYMGWDSPAEEKRAWALARLNEGYARFLQGFNPVTGVIHSWSFLRPDYSLTLEVDKTEYELPSVFGGLITPIVNETQAEPRLVPVSLERIRELKAENPEVAGIPEAYAISPGYIDGTGTAWTLWLYPKPDQAYVLTLRYQVKPTALTDSDECVPFGDAASQDVILQAGIARAELMSGGKQGPMEAGYVSLLQHAVGSDGGRTETVEVESMGDTGIDA